jgi:hypothetical protein
MAKFKYGYGWLLKLILAAILLGVGIYMVFADQVVYTITGIAIVVYSLVRVVPLLKTLEKEVLRTINLIEIIFDVILGGVMIYAGITKPGTTSWDTWLAIYKYMLAFFFYARGLIFFSSVAFFEEKTEVPKFWFHIVAITLGPVILLWQNFSPSTLGWIFLFISVAGSAYLGVDGYGGYKKYREYSKSINTKKEVQKDSKIEKEIPQPIKDEKEQNETYVS